MEHLYSDRAELCDAIYAFKDYAAEAARLAAILESLHVGPGSRLLEGACGTGNHLVHLRRTYSVDGFDRSPEMVAVARDKAPDARLWAADLRDFAVASPYDGFLCLFSSIGYLLDEAALRACAEACARAVRPGGALIVEPWLTADRWDTGRPTLHFVEVHRLWLAPSEVLLRVFGDAGFAVTLDEDGLGTGRGLLVGTRR